MFGCSGLFSLLKDALAWSGLINEGLVQIFPVVADIHRSKSPLEFAFFPSTTIIFELIE